MNFATALFAVRLRLDIFKLEFTAMYIGKAAKLAGTTIKTIRYYEEIGLIPPPKREGKYRVYGQEYVDVLIFVKCAQQLGFTLKELQSILSGYKGDNFPWVRAQQEIEKKKAELLAQITHLQNLHEKLVTFEKNFQEAKEECDVLSSRTEKKRVAVQS